jgi:hypothetical protein
MLTNKQKADKLREAIALLMDVDALQQTALGDSDVCYENHNCIEELIDEFTADVQYLEARAEGTVL